MEVDDTISTIRRQRQAFAFGIDGVQTIYLGGAENGSPMQPLIANVVEDMTFSAWLVPESRQLNTPLKRATENQLAMQLMVGVGGAVDTYYDDWADHESATIRFLRLVRNGVAHGNKIVLTDADPRPDTEWRGFKITRNMEDDQLFTQPADFTWQPDQVEMVEGHLEAGDAYVLATDVLAELLKDSDTYDEGNIISLSKNEGSEWEEWD